MKLFLSITFILFTLFGYAQKTDSDSPALRKCYWIEVAPGVTTLGSIGLGLSANAELNNRWLATISYIGETDDAFDFTSTFTEEIDTFGLLAGKLYKKNNAALALSAGISFVNIATTESGAGIFGSVGKEKIRNTVGIPVMVRAYSVALQTFGFGLGAYANINTVHTTAGLSLIVGIGRFSTHQKNGM